MTITTEELDALQAELGAVLDIYRGKDTAGSFIDTVQYTKAPSCLDLAAEDDFKEYTENYEPASVDFLFHHEGVGSVRVRVSTFNGSVWFRTAVPEEVIEHVYGALLKVKGLVP